MNLNTAAQLDPDSIGHVPADVVDHSRIHREFTAEILRLAAVDTGISKRVASIKPNGVILAWADVLAPRHGGGAALLSIHQARLTVETDLGDGRTVTATFYRNGDRLAVEANVTPAGAANRISFMNPNPSVEAMIAATSKPSALRRLATLLFGRA